MCRAVVALGSLIAVACGDAGTDGAAGAGGATASGGFTASGGAAATGGDGGNAPSTGGTASGGSTGSGGFTASGGSTGSGATGSGGFTASGGSTGSGGFTASGGTGPSSGGAGGGANLPDGVSDLFPLPGSTGVCPDPPLRLTFSGPPRLGTSGRVEVTDVATGRAAASVDLAAATVTDTLGGQKFNLPRPAWIDGNTVTLVLPSRALAYGKRYAVTVSPGAVNGPGNTPFILTSAATWTFETAPAAPATRSAVRVAHDGSGAFCSLQGALDFVPVDGPSRIDVARGIYHGVVYFANKRGVTIHGEDRKGVVVSGTNNNGLNPSTRGRALVGADGVSDLVIENLTIHNLTPQGGSQAEALRLQTCDRCIVRQADILSLQDTLLWSGRLYATDCYIAGNVDFVWGTGAAYFENCEIRTVGRSGYVVQARNPPGAYGYVFVDSRITSDPGITGSVLARVDVSAYPGSQVAYVDCTLGEHISRAGWTVTGGTATSALRFWEYGSKTASGAPVDTSGRIPGSSRISAQQAATLRNKAAVLGGWNP